MQKPFVIKKIAVLGAGVMGSQIAAHCVNANIPTLLYDLPSEGGGHNDIVNKAIKKLTKLKPAPLARDPLLLTACNYLDDLDKLKECDLIIEAIGEKLDWKEALYKKITPFLNENVIIASNTSGLSINKLAEFIPDSHKNKFCGMHFFNPPRYMHLVELIPCRSTCDDLVDNLESFLTGNLGKGIVTAKDTPNFIANRIGVFSLLITMRHAADLGLGLDTVDALTGILIGRPKSATFRTMDVVGLDTMAHVVHTMQKELTNDPWHKYFTLPEWLDELIQKGSLGQKSGAGVYRKNGKTIEVLDTNTNDYRKADTSISNEVKQIMQIRNDAHRLDALFNSTDTEAKFLALCFSDLFSYCAYHLENIADTVAEVDLAMRWGFGWQQGPFETWQYGGVNKVLELIKNSNSAFSREFPSWLDKFEGFYSVNGAFSPKDNQYKKRNQLAVYQRQFFLEKLPFQTQHTYETLYENDGVKLWELENNIAVVSFKSKANTIGQSVLQGMNDALDYAEKNSKALIIYQHDKNNFSSGADLMGVAQLLQNNDIKALDKMIADFQKLSKRIKYVSIPVIGALRGRALGGGLELLLHCDAIVGAFESYAGLVELGVGVIPAGGGLAQMASRAAQNSKHADIMTCIRPYFEQIAMATVTGSAIEAFERDYLKESDNWVMNSDEVLFAALQKTKALLAMNYTPPMTSKFKAAGRTGHAQLQIGLVNWLKGGFISEYDYHLADTLAYVLCGGDVDQGQLIDEDWILKHEREAFVELAKNPLTQARIVHILETGKALRN